MATLLHHIQPWMQKSIAESEARMERRMEAMMDRKADLASLRTDVDAILAAPSVETQAAPTALADDIVLEALFSGTAKRGLHRHMPRASGTALIAQRKRKPTKDSVCTRRRLRGLRLKTKNCAKGGIAEAGTTEGAPTDVPAGSGKPDPPAC
uniref:Integrase core domain containing protein n=1 Tax=Solanum tuberosum TaxID=4113 RepID=M1DEV4_SOLTU